jgi:hypothetical protein
MDSSTAGSTLFESRSVPSVTKENLFFFKLCPKADTWKHYGNWERDI